MKIAFWFSLMVAMSLFTIAVAIEGKKSVVGFGVLSSACFAWMFMMNFVEAMRCEK